MSRQVMYTFQNIKLILDRQHHQGVLDRLHQDSHLQPHPVRLLRSSEDDQGSLNRILNKTALDIIDIGAMDRTPGLECQDLLDRSSLFNRRLAAGQHSNSLLDLLSLICLLSSVHFQLVGRSLPNILN